MRDGREAALWRRTNRIFGWLVPMILILPAVRILPDRLMWWGLAALISAVAVEFAVLPVCPSASRSATSRFPFSSLRSAATTAHPSARNRSTVARPIPLAPPVTTAAR